MQIQSGWTVPFMSLKNNNKLIFFLPKGRRWEYLGLRPSQLLHSSPQRLSPSPGTPTFRCIFKGLVSGDLFPQDCVRAGRVVSRQSIFFLSSFKIISRSPYGPTDDRVNDCAAEFFPFPLFYVKQKPISL
jgi:hypothetical protein